MAFPNSRQRCKLCPILMTTIGLYFLQMACALPNEGAASKGVGLRKLLKRGSIINSNNQAIILSQAVNTQVTNNYGDVTTIATQTATLNGNIGTDNTNINGRRLESAHTSEQQGLGRTLLKTKRIVNSNNQAIVLSQAVNTQVTDNYGDVTTIATQTATLNGNIGSDNTNINGKRKLAAAHSSEPVGVGLRKLLKRGKIINSNNQAIILSQAVNTQVTDNYGDVTTIATQTATLNGNIGTDNTNINGKRRLSQTDTQQQTLPDQAVTVDDPSNSRQLQGPVHVFQKTKERKIDGVDTTVQTTRIMVKNAQEPITVVAPDQTGTQIDGTSGVQQNIIIDTKKNDAPVTIVADQTLTQDPSANNVLLDQSVTSTNTRNTGDVTIVTDQVIQ